MKGILFNSKAVVTDGHRLNILTLSMKLNTPAIIPAWTTAILQKIMPKIGAVTLSVSATKNVETPDDEL